MRPNRGLVVVKVGGAAITDKASHKPRLRVQGLADVVAALCAAHATTSLVVVVGAGSYGHGRAKEVGFSSSKAVAADAKSLLAAVGVRQHVMALAGIVTSALVDAGVPAMHFTPASIDGLEVPLKRLLKAGAVPLLHGDMVLDDAGGLRVLSGDTVAAVLAERFGATRLVFLSGHALHSCDPTVHGAKAELVREVRRSDGGYDLSSVGCENNDVSGAMRGKLEHVLAARGVDVVIAPVSSALAAMTGELPNPHFTTVWKE
jgi:isopentenyl phosphate kinase